MVSFNHVPLFVYGNDQFANLSAPFQNAMPLNTHESAKPSSVPSSLINYPTFHNQFKLGFSSGIRELIDAHLYGSFHLCEVKTYRLKTVAQFCQVRYQTTNLDKRKAAC